jgi:hypothetical protein
MTYCDFYAVRSDVVDVLRYIYDKTDLAVFEMYSEPDCELRRFDTVEDVMQVYDAALSRFTTFYTAHDVCLLLWSPSISPPPYPHRFDMDFDRTRHRFRYELCGQALLRLYLGGLHDTAIVKSHFGNAIVGDASRRGSHDGCDYDALRKLANRIQYHIRKRLAVSQTNYEHILAGAFDAVRERKRLSP